MGEVGSGEVKHDKKMSRCPLPRLAHHQVYSVYEDKKTWKWIGIFVFGQQKTGV